MKKSVLLISAMISLCSVAHADDTIYKCVDATGNIAYVNLPGKTKNNGCTKTNLGNVDKAPMTVRAYKTSSLVSSSSFSGNVPNVVSVEQQNRDDKRTIILAKEFEEESKQLDLVKNMIKNTQGNADKAQFEQLQQMQKNHERNLASLSRELGSKVPAIKKEPETLLVPVDTKKVIAKPVETITTTSVIKKTAALEHAPTANDVRGLSSTSSDIKRFLVLNK